MAAKKIEKMTVFTASIKLKLDVGVEIEANSLAEAVEKANALKVNEIVDFEAIGLEHMDSEKPDVHSVWRNN